MESKTKAGVAVLVSDKIDFKPTKIKRDKEGRYIMVKGSMQQEKLTYIYIHTHTHTHIHTPHTGAPRYIKQVLTDLQRNLDFPTIVVGHFSTHCQH